MRSVTVLMPEDLIQALNKATINTGRTSCSDMIRVILRDYLIEHPAKLVAINQANALKAQAESVRKRRKMRKLPYKCIHITGMPLNGNVDLDRP